jgi:hypothetical protein
MQRFMDVLLERILCLKPVLHTGMNGPGVFSAGGVLHLKSDLRLRHSNLTKACRLW